MKKQPLKQRMYHLTMYNISPIQQGIQSYHSGIEYALKYGRDKEFLQWAKKDKVVIILNGGTSNNIGEDVWGTAYTGSMENHAIALKKGRIKHTKFQEPDLNNSVSAIAFLVDERVWDTVKYPAPVGHQLCEPGMSVPSRDSIDRITYEFYKKRYGAQVAFLRTWLKQFRLA